MNRNISVDLNYYHGFRGGTHHEAVTTEFEWAVKRFRNSYERFSLHIASRCGFGHLSFAEVVLVHLVRMQDQPQTAALLARQLNVDGISNVQYSLRKLLKYKLIAKKIGKGGKLQTYEATEKGNAFMNEYGRLRKSLLTERTRNIDGIDGRLAESTALLRMLIGIYDEAGRVAATFAPPGSTERTEAAFGEA
ncbi:MAG: winged helix DNA-binding protein [Burkholderiaceae bacterium]|nr:winged helix DNA-binding protein [Burkholderiaceae bacterium]